MIARLLCLALCLMVSMEVANADDLVVGGKKLVIPKEKFQIAGITAANPAVVSFAVPPDGPECLSDGGLDDPESWEEGVWVINGGVATITDPPGISYLIQTAAQAAVELVVGETYKIEYEIIEKTLIPNISFSSTSAFGALTLDGSVGVHSYDLVCTSSTNPPIKLYAPVGTGVVILDNLSVRQSAGGIPHDFTVGDSISLSVPMAQILGPDIPRTLVPDVGSPVINGDTVSFADELSSVRQIGYWDPECTYLVNCTVSNYNGTGLIRLPYNGTMPYGDIVYGNGVFQYSYLTTRTVMQIYSFAGHTADVTVNFIKEILPVNGTPYRVTAIDPATGDVTIDANFTGLAAPITSGEAFSYRSSNFKQLSF